ncbi:hypothetical protein ANCCAN_22585 [Ancylostoma caninum]|uniref:Uncharacterized protein n=1 Tax=Ancylostoma caninum TaxID=29170 RepID=A0A368FLD1_ANCCA|nr:hypothetical protein ANCCAN_22585 [Ancylostoma caninum]
MRKYFMKLQDFGSVTHFSFESILEAFFLRSNSFQRHMQRQGFGVYKLILLLIYGCCFWFLFKYLFWDHIQRRFFPEQDNQDQKYTDLLDRIGGFRWHRRDGRKGGRDWKEGGASSKWRPG